MELRKYLPGAGYWARCLVLITTWFSGPTEQDLAIVALLVLFLVAVTKYLA